MRTHWFAFVAVLSLLVPGNFARAADKEAIDFAVERGVAYLKSQQGRDGRWVHQEIGATALAGLALVECGVGTDDPAVAAAAKAVREQSPIVTQTYSIALSIIFLDRLGDAADAPLIESLTVRLLAGQKVSGMWSYSCPSINDAEARRLAAIAAQQNAEGRAPDKGGNKNPRELPGEIQKQIDAVNRNMFGPGGPGGPAAPAPAAFEGGGDNSNTQFAILGLWVGRRHGLPVARALARTDAHFRVTQLPSGGWQYIASTVVMPAGAPMPGFQADGTPAMTCAGLLGLALGFGATKEAAAKKDEKKDPKAKVPEPVDLGKDLAVKRGLLAVGTAIGQPLGNAGPRPPGAIPNLGANANGRGYYFLWSLERVAVAYNLETIGNKDWYGWGSEIILANQANDGGWSGEYGAGGVDTSFALLFLRRANLAKDLSATLKGVLKDPNKFELGAGGVGGAAFLEKVGLKPAFDNDAKAGKKNDAPSKPRKQKATGEAAKLSDKLVKAAGKEQDKVLEELRDSKGADYTEALADAIYKLEGERRSQARNALEDRMTRMTSSTLADKLKDEDPEVRRAAVLAAARKTPFDKTLLPQMVALLEDEELFVTYAARAALKSASRQDFGPSPSAGKEERVRSIARWKEWLAKQKQ